MAFITTASDKVNILLVDDQPGKLLTYEAMLSELGENLIKANSGREALAHLLKHEITVVLMDVSMPELDGFELAEIIHSHPRYNKTAIIFVSAVHLSDVDRLKGYQSGAVDYVSVPVIPELLRAKVGVFTELYRKKRELERLTTELEQRVAERTAELEESVRKQSDLTEQLRQADRHKDEFLALLGHELRNPLAPVRNAVTLLRMQDKSVDRDHTWCIDVIERQTNQLSRLVDDLLDVSRVSQGKIQLQCVEIQFANIVHAAVEMSRPIIDQRHHTLIVRIPEQPLHVYGDMARLTQAVANVLNNAAKYQDEGGRIEVVVSSAGDNIELRVRDRGIGIAPDMLTEVFELFSQGERMPDMAQGGLGVGLSLVRKLVEMHHGSVRLESDGVGLGAEFTLTVPALVVSDATLDLSPQNLSVSNRNNAAQSAPRDILVIDDNRDAADSVGALLRLHGHSVAIVHDGADGIKQARIKRPHIVFLDIGLPGTDGYEVCRKLRSMFGQETQIFAMTGYGQERDRIRARAAGFNAHFVKPVDFASILQVVNADP